jgi:hypothetical protein
MTRLPLGRSHEETGDGETGGIEAIHVEVDERNTQMTSYIEEAQMAFLAICCRLLRHIFVSL